MGQLEGRVIQLKRRAEVHRRTLRRLYSALRLATRGIENSLYVPLGIHIDLYSAFRTQRLVHTLVHIRCLRCWHLRCEQRARPCRFDDKEQDDHHKHSNIVPPTRV